MKSNFTSRYCSPATALEYAAWFAGYFNRGGRAGRMHERDLADQIQVIRERPPYIPALVGAQSIKAIVPAEVLRRRDLQKIVDGLGHNDFYFEEDFHVLSAVTPIVPMFSDVRQILRDAGIDAWDAEQEERQRAHQEERRRRYRRHYGNIEVLEIS